MQVGQDPTDGGKVRYVRESSSVPGCAGVRPTDGRLAISGPDRGRTARTLQRSPFNTGRHSSPGRREPDSPARPMGLAPVLGSRPRGTDQCPSRESRPLALLQRSLETQGDHPGRRLVRVGRRRRTEETALFHSARRWCRRPLRYDRTVPRARQPAGRTTWLRHHHG